MKLLRSLVSSNERPGEEEALQTTSLIKPWRKISSSWMVPRTRRSPSPEKKDVTTPSSSQNPKKSNVLTMEKEEDPSERVVPLEQPSSPKIQSFQASSEPLEPEMPPPPMIRAMEELPEPLPPGIPSKIQAFQASAEPLELEVAATRRQTRVLLDRKTGMVFYHVVVVSANKPIATGFLQFTFDKDKDEVTRAMTADSTEVESDYTMYRPEINNNKDDQPATEESRHDEEDPHSRNTSVGKSARQGSSSNDLADDDSDTSSVYKSDEE